MTTPSSSPRSGVLAAGNWIVDKLKFIDTYPPQDALANILSESAGNGGSPFNVLIDLARLGARFPLCGAGLIGADADGRWVREQCTAHGIDIAALRTHPEAPTSYTDVMTVKSTGRRTFFHQRGANAFLDEGDFDFSDCSARIFHLGYLLLLDRLDRVHPEGGTAAGAVLRRAVESGCKTSVDLVSEESNRFASVVLPTLPWVDYCFLNEWELERTTGMEIRQEHGISVPGLEKACRTLLEAGVREWVVVHFPEGACAMGRDGVLRGQGSLRLPASAIVSAVGAGDAFAAGVLFGLHEGSSIETALQQGVCAAAACLRGAGTSDGVISLSECLALENEFGCRPFPGQQ